MKHIAAALIASFVILHSASAVDRITASVAITNAPTTNGMTFVVNGNTRTWTNAVAISSSQVLTNVSAAGSKTNLYNQISLNPFLQVTLLDAGSTNFQLVAASGVALTVAPSAGYAVITYSTQTVAGLTTLRVPVSAEPTAGARTNSASGIVAGINQVENNVEISQSSKAATQFVGITNTQTITGQKTFSNTNSSWRGLVEGALSISGNMTSLTGGLYYASSLVNPLITNGVNYGNPFRSPGSGTVSEQFGTSARASGDYSLALGNGAQASEVDSMAIGNGAIATNATAGAADGVMAVGNFAFAGADSTVALGPVAAANSVGATAVGYNAYAGGTNTTAVGKNSQASDAFTEATAIGYNAVATKSFQVRLGTASDETSVPGSLKVDNGVTFAGGVTNLIVIGTNSLPAGADVAFGRFANTSLANGNNAAIVVGTNVFVQVSGPSGAFTNCGIAGGRDGKFVILYNGTGQNMTIANDSGIDPTAANRIYTGTGADRTTAGNGTVQLIYNGSESRWDVISFDP